MFLGHARVLDHAQPGMLRGWKQLRRRGCVRRPSRRGLARAHSARSSAPAKSSNTGARRGTDGGTARRERFFSERLYISFNPALAPTRVLPVKHRRHSEENRKAALFFFFFFSAHRSTDFKTRVPGHQPLARVAPDILQLAGVESHSALLCVRCRHWGERSAPRVRHRCRMRV